MHNFTHFLRENKSKARYACRIVFLQQETGEVPVDAYEGYVEPVAKGYIPADGKNVYNFASVSEPTVRDAVICFVCPCNETGGKFVLGVVISTMPMGELPSTCGNKETGYIIGVAQSLRPVVKQYLEQFDNAEEIKKQLEDIEAEFKAISVKQSALSLKRNELRKQLGAANV